MSKSSDNREVRKLRVRKKVTGTAERPRLSVFRSAKHIYAQVINDTTGVTLVHCSSLSEAVKKDSSELKKADVAKAVGRLVGSLCKEKSISKVVFDRSGYMYHGRIKALAEAAREAGLQF